MTVHTQPGRRHACHGSRSSRIRPASFVGGCVRRMESRSSIPPRGLQDRVDSVYAIEVLKREAPTAPMRSNLEQQTRSPRSFPRVDANDFGARSEPQSPDSATSDCRAAHRIRKCPTYELRDHSPRCRFLPKWGPPAPRDRPSLQGTTMTAVLAFAQVLLLAVPISELADRSVLSTSVIFLIAGFLLGQGVIGVIPVHPDNPVVSTLAELALFSVLLTDGMRVGFRDVISAWRLPGRAILLGLPLTLLSTAALARWVLGMDWPNALLLGAVVSPTDPVFAAAIVGCMEVPERLRGLRNGESGLNDSLPLPLVGGLLAFWPERARGIPPVDPAGRGVTGRCEAHRAEPEPDREPSRRSGAVRGRLVQPEGLRVGGLRPARLQVGPGKLGLAIPSDRDRGRRLDPRAFLDRRPRGPLVPSKRRPGGGVGQQEPSLNQARARRTPRLPVAPQHKQSDRRSSRSAEVTANSRWRNSGPYGNVCRWAVIPPNRISMRPHPPKRPISEHELFLRLFITNGGGW